MLAYLAITAGVSFWQWQLDEIEPLLYAFGLFMAFTVAVISHNHNHSAIFHGRYANLLVGYVIPLFYGVMVGLFVLDWRKALLFMLNPQQFSLFVIHIFNYVQHVDCDKHSATNHSRNFTSPVFNYLLFDNGNHTAHHDHPATHWSETAKPHASIEGGIHRSLNVPSRWAWMFRTYLLGRAPASVLSGAGAAGTPV